jgi:hypothetical protein
MQISQSFLILPLLNRGFRPKFGYGIDDNGYLVSCDKKQ